MGHWISSCVLWWAVILHCTFIQVLWSQTTDPPNIGDGMAWPDLYNRSLCRPRWVLRNLLDEFPEYSDSLLFPPCVSILRCAGYCPDEALTCVPTHTNRVTMQVMRAKNLGGNLTEISVLQHTHCECSPNLKVKLLKGRTPGLKNVKKKRRKGKKGRDIPSTPKPLPGKGCPPCNRHKTQNSVTCECVCHRNEEMCHRKGRKLNKRRCRCEKLKG
ncbi:vascular endothelial growth factor B isoform 2-T3 [Discoglossus pictus]